jgi:hypothetical protein
MPRLARLTVAIAARNRVLRNLLQLVRRHLRVEQQPFAVRHPLHLPGFPIPAAAFVSANVV